MPAPVCIKCFLKGGRSGTGSLNNGCTEVHNYFVQFSTATALAQDAMRASFGGTSIPTAGQSLDPRYPLLIAQEVDPQQEDPAAGGDPTVWNVSVKFGPPQPQQREPDPGDGTKFSVDISGTLVAWQENVTTDRDGLIIANSAGDRFPDGLPKTGYDEQITVSFVQVAPDWPTIDECKGKANAEEIALTINGVSRTFAPHTLKLESVSWSLVYTTQGTKVVKVDLVFMYRPDTWTYKPTDMGFNSLDPDTGDLIQIMTDDKPPQPKASPSYLDGSGGVLAEGTDAVQIDVEIIEDTPFTTLLADIST